MVKSVHDGDEDLAATLTELLGPLHPVAAAATVTPNGTTLASVGAPLDADYEIGSITKGITGLLYIDAIARGEIEPDWTVGRMLPALADVPAGSVTLASLSTHSSRLPRLVVTAALLRRVIALNLRGTNPYGDSLEEFLAQARRAKLGKPKPVYSNLGMALLGHAIAAAAGTTYRDLVRERIAGPLGLDVFTVMYTVDQLRPGSLSGRSKGGKRMQPWTGEGIAPAGAIRASIGSMARLANALLDGTAPGVAALDPVQDLPERGRVGAAWFTYEAAGRPVTWHTGGTGGFATWLGLDRAAATATVLLSATSVRVEKPGLALLNRVTGRGAS